MSAQCKIVLNAVEGSFWQVPNATGDIASNGNVGLILVPSAGTNAATPATGNIYGDFGSGTIGYNQTS